jgi:hypothetical protein
MNFAGEIDDDIAAAVAAGEDCRPSIRARLSSKTSCRLPACP